MQRPMTKTILFACKSEVDNLVVFTFFQRLFVVSIRVLTHPKQEDSMHWVYHNLHKIMGGCSNGGVMHIPLIVTLLIFKYVL